MMGPVSGGFMKALALAIILFPLALSATAAHGQRFGGGMGAARGGVVVQGGSAGAQIRSNVLPPHVAPPIVAPPIVVPPLVTPPLVAGPRFFGSYVPAIRPYAIAPAPVFVAPIAPQPYYYPPVWRRYPGTVIIDVPYASESTEIIQVAPGVIQQEPRREEPPVGESRTRTGGQLAPFDPTPQEVVERMLKLANVRSGDVLYDLGAGDGRVIIAAAKKYGVKAIGYEIDPGLAKLARENVQKQGVKNLVEIRQEDFLNADLSTASVVTLYLSHDGNLALRSKLMQQLKPGARVVSYTFDMAEWQPKIAEQYRDGAGNIHMIYLWQAGEPLAFRQEESDARLFNHKEHKEHKNLNSFVFSLHRQPARQKIQVSIYQIPASSGLPRPLCGRGSG
jgi:tRNA A58 N-methylase Trm61